MNRRVSHDTLSDLAQRRGRVPSKQSRKALATIAVLNAHKSSDDETMASPRVYGPYKARSGFRMVVVDGGARKSIVVPTVAAGEKLRADLEQALARRGDRPVSDALREYQDYLHRVRGAVTAKHIARAIERFLAEQTTLASITPNRAAALYDSETRRTLDGKGRAVAVDSHRTVLGQCKRFFAWAVEQGYATQNPFAAVKPVGKPKVGKAQLRIDEARRFVALAVERAQAGDRAATCALMALMLAMALLGSGYAAIGLVPRKGFVLIAMASIMLGGSLVKPIITGTVASPSRPSVKFTSTDWPQVIVFPSRVVKATASRSSRRPTRRSATASRTSASCARATIAAKWCRSAAW